VVWGGGGGGGAGGGARGTRRDGGGLGALFVSTTLMSAGVFAVRTIFSRRERVFKSEGLK